MMKVILVFLTLVYICQCQPGEFFMDKEGKFGLPVPGIPKKPTNGKPEKVMHELMNLNFKMSFFDNELRKRSIRVSRHGFVTIDFNEPLSACPPTEDLKDISAAFIAPFWLPNSEGEVFYRDASTKDLTGVDKSRIETDIRKGFSNNKLGVISVTHALFITWNNMFNANNFPNPQAKRNSFQLALVTLDTNITYAIFVYRVIMFQSIHNLSIPNDQECRSSAKFGIGVTQKEVNRFPLSFFFPLRQDWVACFTNQDEFRRLGRYTFQLSIEAAKQPLPPAIDCSPPNSPFCQKTSWFGINAQIHLDFCKYRDAGIYPYPLSCNRFVYCSPLHLKADVRYCPEGLHFSDVLSVCDYRENVECNLPENSTIIITDPTHVRPTRQTELHNNLCLLRGWQNAADPSSCDHYVSCTNSRTMRRICPMGPFGERLWYSVVTKRCELQQNVQCRNGTRPATETTTTTTRSPPTTKTTTTYVPGK